MSGYIGNAPVPQATQTRQTFTATSGQTSFATVGYVAGGQFTQVYLNGVLLKLTDDYTAANGSDIVLTSGAATGDVLEFITFADFTVNNQNFTGGLTVDNDGSTVLTVDRATSDGTIIDVQKSGSSVGGVGTRNGTSLEITSPSNVELKSSASGTAKTIYYSGTHFSPFLADTASVDLGMSNRTWKDLYLSGGVYLGGTGASNHLDDYEEGDWTPVIKFGGNAVGQSYTSNAGKYIKVGNLVTVFGVVLFSNKGTSSGNSTLTGLPFSATDWSGATSIEGGTIVCSFSQNVNTIYNPLIFAVVGGSTTANGYSSTGDGAALDDNLNQLYFSNSSSLRFSGSYYVGPA